MSTLWMFANRYTWIIDPLSSKISCTCDYTIGRPVIELGKCFVVCVPDAVYDPICNWGLKNGY